jgi:hypothetical protein
MVLIGYLKNVYEAEAGVGVTGVTAGLEKYITA